MLNGTSPAGRLPPEPRPKQAPRVRKSTRAPKADAASTSVRVIKRKPGETRPEVAAPRLSTRNVAPEVTENRTDRLIAKRFQGPMKVVLVLFGVIVVSVFAFGLLRDIPEAMEEHEPEPMHEVLQFERLPNSTNTGILRTTGE